MKELKNKIIPFFSKQDIPYLQTRLEYAEQMLQQCEKKQRYLWRGAIKNVKSHIEKANKN